MVECKLPRFFKIKNNEIEILVVATPLLAPPRPRPPPHISNALFCQVSQTSWYLPRVVHQGCGDRRLRGRSNAPPMWRMG